VRLRRRAAGLVLGALVLFIVGTNVQAGWLLVIAALLLGAVGAGLALPFRMVRGVEVARTAPGRMHQGDAVRVELAVTNQSRGMRASLVVGDPFLADTEVFVSHLAPGERVELVTAREASHRGAQGAEAVVLRSDAPFAVAERRRRIEVAGRALVLPRVEPLDDLPFVERAPPHARAIRSAPRRGGGPEYLGIREYRPGDSMRHVHWPSTARHGAVMVREFEEETTRRLAIIVDSLTDVGKAWTPLDAACSAAASVGLAAAARGQGVRLVVREAGEVAVTAPGEDELLETLALMGPDRRGVAVTVRAIRGELRGMDSALLVLPTWRQNGLEAVAPAVGDLADEAGRVAVLLVEAGSRGAPPEACLPQAALPGLEWGLVEAGASVYRWVSGEPLADVFAREAMPA
jgi:uncharacterized protein (DUF58 family)